MKRFMKGCIITAVIFLVLGAMLIFIGGSLLGVEDGIEEIQQAVDKVTDGKLKVNLDGEGITDLGVVIQDTILQNLVKGEKLYDIDENNEVFFDEKQPILTGSVAKFTLGKEIRDLNLSVGGYVLEAKESEDDSFWAEASHADKMQCYVENEVLYVKATRTGSRNGNLDYDEDSKIILYFPADFCFDKISLNVGAGVLHFADLTGGNIEMEVGMGQINAEKLIGSEVMLSVGMGEVSAKDLEADSLSAKIGMGNLKLTGAIQKTADIDCSIGTVNLSMKGKKKDFNYELVCAMGSIAVAGEECSGMAQEQTIRNGADREMNLVCNGGKIEVSFPEE